MVDITDFTATDNGSYTHTALLEDNLINLSFDVDGTFNEESARDLAQVLDTAHEDDIVISERLGDIHVPYIVFDGEPEVGAQYMGNIMKRLYNSYKPVTVLLSPTGTGNIITAPYTRVNDAQQKEITDTFEFLCTYRDISFEKETLSFLPLNWEMRAFKDGSEMGLDVAFPDSPYQILSSFLSEQPAATKVKMDAKHTRQAALVDSILMYSRQEIKSDMSKARELAPLIAIARSRDMSLFLTTGKCLYRIFAASADGLLLWKEMSVPERHDLCDQYWAELETTSTYYTIHTLQKWAMEDSPEKYKEWNSTSVRAFLEASVLPTGGVADIAGVACAKDPTLFICEGDEVKEAQFYYFNGTYYQPCGTFKVQDYLEKEVIPEYEDFNKDLSKLASANPDNKFKEMVQKKIEACVKIIRSLKDDAFQGKIVKILMRRYNKPGFSRIRDANPHLTGFEDCILDVSPNMVKAAYESSDITKCLRKGMPEDYITCSTGWKLMELARTYSWDHDDVTTVLNNLVRFERDEERRIMLRRQMAASLYGANLRKRKMIIAGPTNNGKSMVTKYWEKALGPVYFPSDIGNNLLYSTDLNPNAPTPSLDAVRNCRILLQPEITDSHIMNEGLVKRLTGKVDTIAGRGMYARKMTSFIPKCTPVTVCNSFPKINGNSAALRTRLLVYYMNSKFISPTDPEWDQIADLDPEERDKFMEEKGWYYADANFDSVIERTYKALMWVMISDYVKYAMEDSDRIVAPGTLPKSVIRDTVSYFTRSNVYLQFFKQACKKEPGAPGVTTYAMYNSYKKWFGDNISRWGFVTYAKFLEEMESMSIKPFNDMFTGIVLTYQ